MIVFRSSQEKYCKDLSGHGAFLVGGRWTLAGTYALYTALNRALAYVEYYVHQFERNTWPKDLRMAVIEIPDEHADYVTLDLKKLPKTWTALPYNHQIQKIGSELFSQGKLGVFVPSVVVKGERNLILNPLHPDFKKKIKIREIEEFNLDERLKPKDGKS